MDSLNFDKWLHADFLKEVLNFGFDTDYNVTCNGVLTKNMTLITIDRGWEGIPESFVINLILCVILLIPFGIVKYFASARSYFDSNHWLKFIYGNNRDIHKKSYDANCLNHIETYFKNAQPELLPLLPLHTGKCKANSPGIKIKSYGTEQSLCKSNSPPSTSSARDCLIDVKDASESSESESVAFRQPISQQNSSRNLVEHETTFSESVGSSFSTIEIRRKNLCFYFLNFFTNLFVSDNDILKNKGHDAYQYLLFQRYIICFLCVVSFFSLILLLPVNIQGNIDSKAFARTTLSNLPSTSSLYWVYAGSSTIIVVVGIYMMSHFSKTLRTDDNLTYCKTLLFRRLPMEENVHQRILDYFNENFPDIKLTGIQLILGYRRLESLQDSYDSCKNAIKYCSDLNSERNSDDRVTLRPYTCGQLGFCCCCCCGYKDAEEYYRESMQSIKANIDGELHHMAEKKIGSVFVSFETEKMATSVYKKLKDAQKRTCNLARLVNFFNHGFDIMKCLVSYAPYPDDINWRDIAVDVKLLWLRKIFLSLFLFIVFFFLSTPAFLLKGFELVAKAELIRNGIGRLTSSWMDFLSPFLMMLMSIVLPSIVTYVCNWIPYKTVSDHNHAIMSKVYAFLLMMIVILPSAGFLSINALLHNIFLPDADRKKFRWHCLFPVDNGAFFVIYALQAAILGNVMEILRIPELTLYIVYNLILPSNAEYNQARKWVLFEFPFGVSYARFMLVFTMTIIYSQACPLIAPCGLLYMIGKHIVDRYNIYYVYQPTKINGRIHSSAILYVHIALILMQFQLFTFLITKTRYSDVTMFTLIVLLVSLLGFAFYCFYHWFRNLNHITNSITSKSKRVKKDLCICSFTPPVFFELVDSEFFTEEQTQPKVGDHQSLP